MKIQSIKVLLALATMTLLQGCSSMNVDMYQNEKPQLDLFSYFDGYTKAYGQFQNRSGQLIRRFEVDIQGSINKQAEQLKLDESFVYHDGEKQTRVWYIDRAGDKRYSGKADDVIGQANGKVAGNAFRWQYTLDLPYKNGTIHVQFDDWMYLHNDKIMLNRAEVTKWGFKVGEVTLVFIKQE
ncbi:DUF3833 domain-containing protein [Thiomicrorhabdus sediminis]|uniref:DUF3833 domain-containing protein n=1 Tax=Thiomicrorhabdus sediminis TaxID=2580412 RepID=A0A4V1HHR2_9GAMM|nr:DUF3833 domain-containing protein [Thiomicrorhabdus sediminis]QCU89913.1 DUF3833 domain-containing protein [Thiomicrorhabdus sediminis]